MSLILPTLCVFWLAYSNGANDNFKGVETLYGSATTDFRRALMLRALATLGGSVVSLVLASSVAKSFTGGGLVPEVMAGHSNLLISVSAGAAATVLIATFLGMPTSATHALTGALILPAWVATVPCGAACGAGAMWLLTRIGGA